MIQFYVDTCIWINLFKKEGIGSYPYWKITKDFLNFVKESSHKEVIFSNIILKELQYKLELFTYQVAYNFLKETGTKVDLIEEDYLFAQKLEEESLYELSFADYLHIAICKRLNLVLVTRDADLLLCAQEYIITEKPENLMY
jgi:predicted nucleic acid-binding protein